MLSIIDFTLFTKKNLFFFAALLFLLREKLRIPLRNKKLLFEVFIYILSS